MNPMIIFMAIIGGLIHALMWAKSFEELRSFYSFKVVVLAILIGFLYDQLHSEYTFPNGVMSFVAGYMGVDFIEGLVEKMKAKAKGGV